MTSAVIVAAGRGTRMGPGIDKLFYEVAGRPVVAHTWSRFDSHGGIDHVVLVVRPGLEDAFREMASIGGFRKPWSIVQGGSERQDSVWNGLQAMPAGTELVAIQDGARPCTSPEHLGAILAAASETGGAVAASPVTDTLKQSTEAGMILRTVDRTNLWSVQTPQAFRAAVILKAFEELRRRGLRVTDDTAACELIGQPVRLIPSDAPNPKVTVPGDLAYVEVLLRASC